MAQRTPRPAGHRGEGPPEQHGSLKAPGRINDACLGVIASVEQPGRIELGDVALVKN